MPLPSRPAAAGPGCQGCRAGSAGKAGDEQGQGEALRQPGKGWESSRDRCAQGRPEGRCLASWSQGGPCVPSTAAAGEHLLHEGWNAKALPQAHRDTAGVDLAKPGTALRLPAPPVGTGGREGLETDFPSFARETGFSTMIKTPLHKSWG